MDKALHPGIDVEKRYVSRKEKGGRGLASIEDRFDVLKQRREDYREKPVEGQITATRKDTDNTKTNRMIITRKQKCEGKQLYGCFEQLINSISFEKTWM